eukprot:872132-Prorocentrum_minimum.AAC.3
MQSEVANFTRVDATGASRALAGVLGGPFAAVDSLSLALEISPHAAQLLAHHPPEVAACGAGIPVIGEI